jgi:hypothetical protein
MGNTCLRRKENNLRHSSTPDEDVQKILIEKSILLCSDADHARELNELIESKQKEFFKHREEDDTKDFVNFLTRRLIKETIEFQ